MSYRERELADYLEDCRTRNVTPRLHYVKFLKSMIEKEQKKRKDLLEAFDLSGIKGLWEKLKER